MPEFGQGCEPAKCGFCGDPEGKAAKLVGGVGVQICDECIRRCVFILDEQTDIGESAASGPVRPLPIARVVRPGRGLANVATAYHATAKLIERREGVELDSLDPRRITLRSVDTDDGPAILLTATDAFVSDPLLHPTEDASPS